MIQYVNTKLNDIFIYTLKPANWNTGELEQLLNQNTFSWN